MRRSRCCSTRARCRCGSTTSRRSCCSRYGPGEELAEIEHAAEQAAALTRQLLAFSRRQVLHPRVLDLNEIVAGMEPMLGRIIGEDVELSVSLADGQAVVEADRAQLE